MDGDSLAAAFEDVEPFTVGLEEEAMLLDPDTLDLAERAPEMLARLGDGPAPFKLELPASQLELVTRPRRSVSAAIGDLAAARRELLDACDGLVRPAAAGAHPFAAPEGALNRGPRYDRAAAEYGWVARRQLVCALQVHVAVGGAERTLAVYNALREELPALAALAANAPLRAGRDTGLASVRPALSGLLPRQGIPPAFASWDEVAEAWSWGAATGTLPEPGFWWWELRPHPRFGTLELRVPDAQTTLADAAAVTAVAHALVVELAERHDAGELPPPAPDWRIAENRWAACRYGVEGALADARDGTVMATREWLGGLLERLAPVATGIGAAAALADAQRLVEDNGALRQRSVATERGARGLAGWLADSFGEGL
jgi:glutamate---cysteine ligase / carboxylate-amine ligase